MKGREGEDGSDETVAVLLPRELEMERLESKGWTEGGLATRATGRQARPVCRTVDRIVTYSITCRPLAIGSWVAARPVRYVRIFHTRYHGIDDCAGQIGPNSGAIVVNITYLRYLLVRAPPAIEPS